MAGDVVMKEDGEVEKGKGQNGGNPDGRNCGDEKK
jgi:hypothetical protein